MISTAYTRPLSSQVKQVTQPLILLTQLSKLMKLDTYIPPFMRNLQTHICIYITHHHITNHARLKDLWSIPQTEKNLHQRCRFQLQLQMTHLLYLKRGYPIKSCKKRYNRANQYKQDDLLEIKKNEPNELP